MKKKGNFRKVVSGLLAGMTMLSTVLSPMTAYAAEIQPEEKPPLYEEVKDLLDEDEVVTVRRYPFGACSSRKVYLPIGSFSI